MPVPDWYNETGSQAESYTWDNIVASSWDDDTALFDDTRSELVSTDWKTPNVPTWYTENS